MKRVFFVILSVIMTLALTACSEVKVTPSPQPTEAPSPSAKESPYLTPEPSELSVLKKGMQGEAIVKLQDCLIELGYMQKEDADGKFGEDTLRAVKEFQDNNGFENTGEIDKEQAKLLLSGEAKGAQSELPLSGVKIGLDPGHQRHSNREQEPVSPGSSETKKKVSSGTQGVASGVPEYEVNLAIGLRLRDLLEEQGAEVIMTRETHDVDISNAERAQIFNKAKTDYALRLHCDGSDETSKHGAFVLVPDENPYLEECSRAAQLLIDAYCEETGAENRGLSVRDDQTGFNWCDRMIINIEMGYMSNREEDLKLTDSDYQEKMAQGLLNGILKFFE